MNKKKIENAIGRKLMVTDCSPYALGCSLSALSEAFYGTGPLPNRIRQITFPEEKDTRLSSLRSLRPLPTRYNFWNGTAMAEQRDLPGWPKKRLVKEVRRHLWRYGIRPQWAPWRATWSWANAIAISYYHTRWPSPSEISTQYILLLLVEMKANFSLRLPYRAGKVIPDEVRAMLPGNPVPLLIHEPVIDGKKAESGNVAE